MRKLNEKGDLLIPLVLIVVLLLAAIGFGVWAFMGRQDYKNNSDAKAAKAVEVAEENLALKKDAEFAEQYKLPNTTYKGPGAFGTLGITYPKTWSVYVDDRGTGGTPVDGTMHPGYVTANTDINYALRFQVAERPYDQELNRFSSAVRSGRVSVAAYRLPKVGSVLGSRLTGEIEGKKQGVLILLPLRDKSIRIWTEGNEFRGDFEKILESFTFIP